MVHKDLVEQLLIMCTWRLTKMQKKFLVLSQFLLLSALAILLFGGMGVNAVIGEPNATVQTLLDIGNVYPEILSTECNLGAALDLTPANTTTLTCVSVIRDWNGEADINQTNGNVFAEFFDTVESTGLGDADDGGDHYTNSSCVVDDTYGDAYEVQANCTFEVQYYANPGSWNFTVFVNDTLDWQDVNSTSQTVSALLAIGLPDNIHYGTVNATFVSEENQTNVTNYGNSQVNLSLEGYAQTPNDGYAMNCSLGAIGFIDVDYEKYNLTATTPGTQTLTQFEANYTNLSTTPDIRQFELNYRQDDPAGESIKPTYWRIYVPIGVAGTCEGNIVFGATTAVGS